MYCTTTDSHSEILFYIFNFNNLILYTGIMKNSMLKQTMMVAGKIDNANFDK